MESFDRYAWERECSKAQIYKIFRTRKEAVADLLVSKAAVGDTRLFLQEKGLGSVYRFNDARRGLEGLLPDESVFNENGYNNKQEGTTIMTSSLRLTYHFMRRWNERCGQAITGQMFRLWGEDLATLYIDDDSHLGQDLFFPISQGAIIFTPYIRTIIYSIADAKLNTNQSLHQYTRKNTNGRTQGRWVGQYLRISHCRYAKTFIGWDQLRKGGTYDNISWYKGKFANQEAYQRVSDLLNTHLAK